VDDVGCFVAHQATSVSGRWVVGGSMSCPIVVLYVVLYLLAHLPHSTIWLVWLLNAWPGRAFGQSVDEMDAATAELERMREKATEIKYITHVELGGCEINTW